MTPDSSLSGSLYERLLRGEATSGEYVAALRAEARNRVQSLRGADRVTDAAKSHGQGVDGGPVAPEPCPTCAGTGSTGNLHGMGGGVVVGCPDCRGRGHV